MPVALHIVQSADPRCTGICRIISALARHAAALGYDISVLFFEDGPLREDLQREGITAVAVPWSGTKRDVAGALRVLNWMRVHPAQVTHIHQGGKTVRLLARAAGSDAVVYHVHTQVVEPALSSISKLRLSGFDAVVASSQAVAGTLSDSRSEVIYAGIDTSSEPPSLPSTVGPLRIGVLSRLVPLKRIEAVIEAHARLTVTGIELQTEICGEGLCEPSLRELARKLGAETTVRFLGWRKDAATLLATWDLLAMPSMYEGFPIAVLEAMAARRAVVASRVGGLPELVEDGSSGILFPSGDTDALVQALRTVSTNRTMLARMGDEGWKRARTVFSSSRMAEQMIELYNRVLKR